jgi:hypothetical protein
MHAVAVNFDSYRFSSQEVTFTERCTMCSLRFIFRLTLPGALLIALFAFICPFASRAQDDALFDTNDIEQNVLLRFKLSARDMRLLHPVIYRENRALVLSYFHYSEASTDFLSLWNSIRINRHEVEANSAAKGRTARQNIALSKARDALERRVLGLWIDDHVGGMAELLELDRVQQDGVLKIFESESEKRHKLIAEEIRRQVSLNVEWHKLTEERNRLLRAILDPLQFRDYIQLNTVTELIA